MSNEEATVGGDLSKAFDPKLILSLIHSDDLIGVILRIHFSLEELLNLWCDKITKVDNFLDIGFIGFDKKLLIAKKLGLPNELFLVFKQFNKIRNSFAHDHNQELDLQKLIDIKNNIDAIETFIAPVPKISEGSYVDGINKKKYKWDDSDLSILKKFVYLYMVFSMKVIYRFKYEFSLKNLDHKFTN
ncbi:hypothetical protein [Acinetobacter baumannii]|uniref:hypothetical protein n=1 Tax=Acinetobacter baumannii TaxID=470 RepID=UPI00234144E8|nr:hypothetical protein [Acinetobacter baumannii]MDC4688661.1 hypothetical protein [Acinetobacter baumannii]MDC4732214.1 hypothetical protein [Acinetobacter baumannii]MDH2586189.1 hypothetical protein [Acinetobacter baumannii]MDI9665378.1 hypothetical protein [Acinetobacter baumannii]MDI9712456.1 hypothetical protein [Acinetobacter baumannii]